MNCSSVCIFKDEAERKNIEMYKRLADLIMRIEGEIYPDCLAVSKRSDKFWSSYDDAHMTKRERKEPYDESCRKIEEYLQRLKVQGIDVAEYEALYESDIQADELQEKVREFFWTVVYGLDIRFLEAMRLESNFLTYCKKFEDFYFKTKKDDIFMWVSGKYHEMSEQKLLEAAKTPEEKELASKVMFGFGRHFEKGYWFTDMDEPKLPSWKEKFGCQDAV